MNQLEGRNILITGASGFIGKHLITRLSAFAGVKLLLLSRQDRQFTQTNQVWIKSELGRLTKEFWRAMGIGCIDYVFHLGAFTPKISIDANRIDGILDDNIAGTRALLQSLPGKPQKLVLSSTLDVYEQPNNGEVLTESSKVCPSTLYGASKLFCETLVSVWARECGCNYAVLRYGHIYGPGEEQYGKLIPIVVRNLLANEAPVLYGDGSALRDYLYVGDAVEATIRAALAEGSIEPINVVRGESITLKEIVQLLIRLVGSDLRIKFLSDKSNGHSFKFDNERMMKSLGHWSMTSLAEGLATEVQAFREIADARKLPL